MEHNEQTDRIVDDTKIISFTLSFQYVGTDLYQDFLKLRYNLQAVANSEVFIDTRVSIYAVLIKGSQYLIMCLYRRAALPCSGRRRKGECQRNHKTLKISRLMDHLYEAS